MYHAQLELSMQFLSYMVFFFYSLEVDRSVVTICRLFSVRKLIFWKAGVEYLTSCLNYSIGVQYDYSQVRCVFNSMDLLG